MGVFSDAMSKGKKNEHAFHNSCLNFIINVYDNERVVSGKPKISVNIIHTDNFSRQYTFRQKILTIAMFNPNNGSTSRLIHCFAQKYGFKVLWGTTGKLVKYVIMRNEARFNRFANAIDCYLKLLCDLTKNGTENNPKRWV